MVENRQKDTQMRPGMTKRTSSLGVQQVSFPPIFLTQRKYEKKSLVQKNRKTNGSRTDGGTNFGNNLLFAIPSPPP